MSAEEVARIARGAARRVRSAKWDLQQIQGPPGEFPRARRQVLEQITDDVIVAEHLLNKILELVQ
jgi:hypothetical protein